MRPARDELIARGLPVVRRVARRLAHLAKADLDVEDLEGWGALALLDHVDRWDQTAYGNWEDYLGARVRWRIIDEWRRWRRREVGPPSVTDRQTVFPVRLAPVRLPEGWAPPASPSPEGDVVAQADVVRALRQLPHEQQVVVLWYADDRHGKDLAAAWGVDPGRISQLRTKALRLLRSRLAA